MSTQTVFKAGNSKAITLSNELGFNLGEKVVVTPGLIKGTAYISKAVANEKASSITPDFLKVLAGINKRYGKALKELAGK